MSVASISLPRPQTAPITFTGVEAKEVLLPDTKVTNQVKTKTKQGFWSGLWQKIKTWLWGSEKLSITSREEPLTGLNTNQTTDKKQELVTKMHASENPSSKRSNETSSSQISSGAHVHSGGCCTSGTCSTTAPSKSWTNSVLSRSAVTSGIDFEYGGSSSSIKTESSPSTSEPLLSAGFDTTSSGRLADALVARVLGNKKPNRPDTTLGDLKSEPPSDQAKTVNEVGDHSIPGSTDTAPDSSPQLKADIPTPIIEVEYPTDSSSEQSPGTDTIPSGPTEASSIITDTSNNSGGVDASKDLSGGSGGDEGAISNSVN